MKPRGNTMTEFRNWSGHVRFTPAVAETPANLDELRDVLEAGCRGGFGVRAVGSGHSFTPLVRTSGALVSLDRFDSIGEVDGNGVIPVGAGIKLHALGLALRERGRAQENLGDINEQSLAGAISTGTHGTGLSLGTISTQAQWLRILTASGEVVRLDRDENPDEFRAAATSLGALGLLIEVGLRTLPAYGLELIQQAQPIADSVAGFESACRSNRHVEFFWFPHTQTTLSKITNVTRTIGRPPNRAKRFVDDIVLENGVFEVFNQWARYLPAQAPRSMRSLAALSRVAGGKKLRGPADSIFATKRMTRFQEMEYGLPLGALGEAVERIERFTRDRRIAVSFPVEVRAVAADDLWLSPAHGRESVFMAVHMNHAMPHEEYFRGVEEIFCDLGGRPHWGKLHTRRAAALRDLYPRFDDFLALRDKLDPDGVFLNDHLRGLFLDSSGR